MKTINFIIVLLLLITPVALAGGERDLKFVSSKEKLGDKIYQNGMHPVFSNWTGEILAACTNGKVASFIYNPKYPKKNFMSPYRNIKLIENGEESCWTCFRIYKDIYCFDADCFLSEFFR